MKYGSVFEINKGKPIQIIRNIRAEVYVQTVKAQTTLQQKETIGKILHYLPFYQQRLIRSRIIRRISFVFNINHQ